MAADALASTSDVADVWRPLTADEAQTVQNLIEKASAKLRHTCPFDIDERIALYQTTPTDPKALDPRVVADVVATIVKRFLVNVEGAVSTSETVGPFNRSTTYVSRYDRSGADARGGLLVTESDIDQLRPPQPAVKPATLRIGAGATADPAFRHGRTDRPEWPRWWR